MSDEVEIKLPKLGESIVSATVVQWFKKEGDLVKLDEPLLEVSTDKVNSEIPAPVAGMLTKIMAEPAQELDVGAPLAMIATTTQQATETSKETVQVGETPSSAPSKKGFFTPALLKMAQEKGIDLKDLEHIPATGAGGRLSKRDLEKYLASQKTKCSPSFHGDVQRVKMSPMRKMIADAMVNSFYTAPHASLVYEVDVTNLIKKLQGEKESFLKENGFKLTITSYIGQAISLAAEKFPMINASLEGDMIVMKKNVNLGIAVSVEQGILVPVIKKCNTLSLKEIAREVATLSDKARKGNLSLDQVQEGTITMTNFGMAGALIGTPIIRQPEVAIVGIGSVTKQVVPLKDETVGIRSILHLSLSIDHRVIDGMYGCEFLTAVKNSLENP